MTLQVFVILVENILNEILLHSKKFKLYIDHKQIETNVTRVAKEITNDLSEKAPVFICLLTGAFLFAADLIRKLSFECNIAFVKLSSYKGTQSTGNVTQILGLDEKIENRHVVLVEDIVDSGATLNYFLNELKELKPASVSIAAMFHKPGASLFPIHIDYLGMKIENKFVVGYGLDYDGLGRNYKDLYIEI